MMAGRRSLETPVLTMKDETVTTVRDSAKKKWGIEEWNSVHKSDKTK